MIAELPIRYAYTDSKVIPLKFTREKYIDCLDVGSYQLLRDFKNREVLVNDSQGAKLNPDMVYYDILFMDNNHIRSITVSNSRSCLTIVESTISTQYLFKDLVEIAELHEGTTNTNYTLVEELSMTMLELMYLVKSLPIESLNVDDERRSITTIFSGSD